MIRRLPFFAGALVLAALWLGPLPTWSQRSFGAHMTMHMGVVAVAAPLLAFGLAGSRWDPVRRWPALLPAVPLSIVELVVVWAWHAPALHLAARTQAGALVLEQASFAIAGLLVWLSAVSGGQQPRERAAAGVAALLLTSMHMTLLGALLALTPRALYPNTSDVCYLPPLQDQHLGGALMLLVGGIVYLAGGLWLVRPLVRAPREAREDCA